MNIKKLLKKILIIVFLIYFSYIIFSQQQSLNSYAESQKYYSEQISLEKENKEELLETKNNINSLEYIEKIAREKLNMYLPNERVYVDQGM